MTERLVLRCPRSGDGKIINVAICATFNDLHRWMDWAESKPTVEQSEATMRKFQVRFIAREEMVYLLFLKGTETFVGVVGLTLRRTGDCPSSKLATGVTEIIKIAIYN